MAPTDLDSDTTLTNGTIAPEGQPKMQTETPVLTENVAMVTEGDVSEKTATETVHPEQTAAAETAQPEQIVPTEAAEAPAELEVVVIPEDERLWKIVEEDPSKFDTFGELVKVVEKTNDLEKIRKVLRFLLSEYPLCFGYWKRLAGHEKKNGNIKECTDVMEQGVIAVPQSHRLWTYYCNEIMGRGDIEATRKLFERASEVIYNDYKAHKFWAKYLEFEMEQASVSKDYSVVQALYTKILSTPMQQLDLFWKKYKGFAVNHTVKSLCTPEDLQDLENRPNKVKEHNARRAKIIATKEERKKEKERLELERAEKEMIPGEEDDADDMDTKDASEDEDPGEELPELTEEDQHKFIMEKQEAHYTNASKEKSEVDSYESGISRAHFHVKPLDEAELVNWNNYLDYIDALPASEKNARKQNKLYERCVVAAANYPEYWIRYATFMQKMGNSQGAREVFVRTCDIFTKKRPEAYLAFALFEENQNSLDAARSIYKKVVEKISPLLLEAVVQYANFERRQNSHVKAVAVYKQALDRYLSLFLVLDRCRCEYVGACSETGI